MVLESNGAESWRVTLRVPCVALGAQQLLQSAVGYLLYERHSTLPDATWPLQGTLLHLLLWGYEVESRLRALRRPTDPLLRFFAFPTRSAPTDRPATRNALRERPTHLGPNLGRRAYFQLQLSRTPYCI